MQKPAFDVGGLFDDDYLFFFADRLDQRADAETDLIWDLLELTPGMRVLDLACGHGRIANRLAERGCQVTGLDSTATFLDRARRDARARGVTVDYVRGDMRRLPWTAEFDRVISWFTSFGYFEDDDNQRVLGQAATALRPAGRLLLDLNHYAELARIFQSAVVIERGDDLLVDQNRLDPLTGRSLVTRTVLRGGVTRRVPFFVRLFTFPELRDRLHAAGFTSVTGLGEDRCPLSAESNRMITIAAR